MLGIVFIPFKKVEFECAADVRDGRSERQIAQALGLIAGIFVISGYLSVADHGFGSKTFVDVVAVEKSAGRF